MQTVRYPIYVAFKEREVTEQPLNSDKLYILIEFLEIIHCYYKIYIINKFIHKSSYFLDKIVYFRKYVIYEIWLELRNILIS